MSAAASLANPEPVWTPRVNPWLIAFVVSLAAFMEVLDTSIANVALPHIAGNMGASSDESTWVLTSYLVSNAIVLPITGWLVSLLGRKRFFHDLHFVVHREFAVLRHCADAGRSAAVARDSGRGGGGLQPMAQAILADTFPPKKRGLAFSVYGVTAVVAPSIGPTLGGWITDNYTWRWIFLMNLPVGHHGDLPGAALCRRSAVSEANDAEGEPDRLHRFRTAGDRGRVSADCAGQRTGGRLVRIEFYSDA